MKKFIITEEETNRILGMHEDHGYNSLNEQNITEATAGEMEASGARYNDNVANNVKNMALVKAKSPKFPCVYYKKDNLNTEGRYTPANMDFVRLFNPNSIVVYWEKGQIVVRHISYKAQSQHMTGMYIHTPFQKLIVSRYCN